MNKILLWVVGAAWLSVSSCACRVNGAGGIEPEKQASSVRRAATPEEAVLNWLKAFETEDKALFLASCDILPEHREYVDAQTDSLFSLAALRREMTDAYGPGGAKGISMPMPKVEDVTDRLTVEQAGDSAIVTGVGSPIRVVKKGDAWLVAMPVDVPPPRQEAIELRWFQLTAKAVARVRPMIGKPGVDAAKVWEEMNKIFSESVEK